MYFCWKFNKLFYNRFTFPFLRYPSMRSMNTADRSKTYCAATASRLTMACSTMSPIDGRRRLQITSWRTCVKCYLNAVLCSPWRRWDIRTLTPASPSTLLNPSTMCWRLPSTARSYRWILSSFACTSCNGIISGSTIAVSVAQADGDCVKTFQSASDMPSSRLHRLFRWSRMSCALSFVERLAYILSDLRRQHHALRTSSLRREL